MDKIKENKWFYLSIGFIGAVAANTLARKLCKCDKNACKKTSTMVKDAIEVIKSDDTKEVKAEKKPSPNAFASLQTGRLCVPPVEIPNLTRICFTGGPCGGKTASLNYVAEKLRKIGYRVLIVPEAPTILAQGGGMINVHLMTSAALIKFQNTIVRCVIDLEDNLSKVATISGDPTILLCDRGTLDPRAYMVGDTWRSLLDDNNWNVADLRDNRYHGVIHIVTAADGAEKYYSLENNAARYESTHELAVSTDINLRNAWLGHHSFVMIENPEEGGFDKKLERVYDTVLHFLGKKEHKYFKSFLLKTQSGEIPTIPANLRQEIFEVEETFLKSDKGQEERVSKRTKPDGSSAFYSHLVVNSKFGDLQADVKESREQYRIITSGEYIQLLERTDPHLGKLKKTRQFFNWNRTTWSIDTFVNAGGFSLLYCQHYKDIETIKMPDGIVIDRQVTDDDDYSSLKAAEKAKNL
jgi:hypothetical protein